MKASVLSIGSELLDGQINNSNATWISRQLKQRGVDTVLHHVTPDHRELMLEGIKICAEKSDLIFITGGLGPTSDDFTRDIIANWSQRTLEFDQESWKHINERLQSRGYKVRDIQRQQCYFPAGSRVLKNTEGTANAFFLHAQGKDIFALPGPPKEIAAIWKDHIDSWLNTRTQNQVASKIKIWNTLGKGESEVAERVIAVTSQCPFELGYRVHLPYVEVKLNYLKSQEILAQPWIQAIDNALHDITFYRDNEEPADLLLQELKKINRFEIQDDLSQGRLLKRLGEKLSQLPMSQEWSLRNHLKENTADILTLALHKTGPYKGEVRFSYQGKTKSQSIESPYHTDNMQSRSAQLLAEVALLEWIRMLA